MSFHRLSGLLGINQVLMMPNSDRNPSQANQESLPTPSKIVDHLAQFIRGQKQAKQSIALALYTKLLYISCRCNPTITESLGFGDRWNFDSQHFLFIGPTGSGKSYLVKQAAEFIQLPCSFVAATSLVQTGYVGTSIDKMIESHYFRCGKDRRQVEQSIIFVDED